MKKSLAIVLIGLVLSSCSTNPEAHMAFEEVRYIREFPRTYSLTAQDAESVDEARIQIQKRLPEIEAVAKEKMQQKGYSYDADATLSSCYFPVKTYGDMIFPAGEYEALKVNLGKSAGKNWWCVMYPTLCFVDSTYQIVPGESKEKLKKCLTEEEYNSLLDGENGIETSSLFIEWIRNILFS